jgi:hypothetical protein
MALTMMALAAPAPLASSACLLPIYGFLDTLGLAGGETAMTEYMRRSKEGKGCTPSLEDTVCERRGSGMSWRCVEGTPESRRATGG